jgi:outer membrane immunogenic protein
MNTLRKLLVVLALCVCVTGAFAISAPASAADMPIKAPVIAAPIPFSWTGIYIGVHGGADWFDKDWFASLTPINIAGGCPGCPTTVGAHSASSWLAGGQIGFNYQFQSIVAGIEAQASWTRLEASNPNLLAPAFITNHSKTDFIGTLAGRLGYAWDHALVYAKGGGAWAHDQFFTSTTVSPVAQSLTETRWGWMAGVGFEYAFTNNWSAKIEYDYLDFGRRRETLQPVVAAGPFEYDIKQTIQLVKVGINYRFSIH